MCLRGVHLESKLRHGCVLGSHGDPVVAVAHHANPLRLSAMVSMVAIWTNSLSSRECGDNIDSPIHAATTPPPRPDRRRRYHCRQDPLGLQSVVPHRRPRGSHGRRGDHGRSAISLSFSEMVPMVAIATIMSSSRETGDNNLGRSPLTPASHLRSTKRAGVATPPPLGGLPPSRLNR